MFDLLLVGLLVFVTEVVSWWLGVVLALAFFGSRYYTHLTDMQLKQYDDDVTEPHFNDD